MVYFSSKFGLAAIAVSIVSSLQGVLSAPLVARDVEHWGNGCPQDDSISVRVDGNRYENIHTYLAQANGR